jgi:peptidoglycan biosynthesis protein MviN/MurJ (putative lipid II flippase)
MLMLNRGFFSLQSAWTPTWIALANLALNAVLDAAFYRLGTWGIPLATSVVNIAGTTLLLILLRRRLGRIDFARTAAATWRIVVAAGVLAAVAYGVWRGLDAAFGRALWAQFVSVGTALSAGTVAYLVSARLLGVRELDALLALRERFRGR